MVSYAQNFEDVILNRVFNNRASGFYIDLGAMDPVYDSVTKAFYDRGWRGINVEPSEYFYKRLAAERERDINLNIAVGDVVETRPLYVFEGFGLSTFDPEFRRVSVEHGYSYQEVTCNVTTLAEVCRQYVDCPIDFLKIDAEGWEGPILRGGDWANFRPTVLIVEAIHPFIHEPEWACWEPFLLEQCDYLFVYFDGVNRFYVPREYEELVPAFSRPACILDGFQMYATVEAEQRAAKLKQDGELMKAGLKEAEDQCKTLRATVENMRALEEVLRRDLASERSQVEKLKEQLRDSRLWVGRLSEQLTATRIRANNP